MSGIVSAVKANIKTDMNHRFNGSQSRKDPSFGKLMQIQLPVAETGKDEDVCGL